MRILKRLTSLEEKIDKLMVYVPKLYSLLIHSKSTYPCEMYRNTICSSCTNENCAYNPNGAAVKTADEVIDDFIKTVKQGSQK